MKKLISLVLALAMVLTMTTAFAASITISRDATYDSDTNQAYTYKAYKIFDASYTSLTGTGTQDAKDPTYTPSDANVSYFMATGNPWISTVQGMTSYFTVTPAADGSGYSVALKDGVNNNATTAQAIVAALKTALATVNPTGGYAGIDIQAGASTPTTVDPGYYMIVGDANANLAIVTTDVTIVEKNEYPKLIKEFADETTVGTFANQHADESSSAHDTVQVGDTVFYTLTVQIPSGANQAMTVNDSYTSGLSPVLDSEGKVAFTAENMVNGTTATANAPANNAFSISITAADVIANAGRTISFTYSAVVTADAWKQTEVNTGEVVYGNTYTTKPDHVDSVTYNLTIQKKAGSAEGDSLKGAKFELYRKSGETKTIVNLVAVTDTELEAKGITKAANTVYYRVVAAGTSGATTAIDMTDAYDAVIYGLDGDSTYSIRETQAPVGYNKLEEDQDVAMNKANQVQPIVNNAGTVLPSTGGIGTTIFYIVGGMLLVGAAIVLVARRKASEN